MARRSTILIAALSTASAVMLGFLFAYATSRPDVPLRHLKNGDRPWVVYDEYACPGCGTLLQVDTYCPETDGQDRVVWDTRLDLDALLAAP